MKENRGIDHLVLCVRSLDAALAAYARLGFTMTPTAHHPWGTANRLVQLNGNFLELLTVAEPEKVPRIAPGEFTFGAYNKAFLDRREGFSGLVFASADARRDQKDFAASGLQTYPTFDFSRQAKLPSGREVTVGFSLSFVTDPRMPEVVFFVSQQHAAQHFWKPEYQRHANGALAVSEVVMLADEPTALADLFGRLQGPDAVASKPGQLSVRTARGQITVLDRPRAAERFGAALPGGPQSPHLIGYRVAVSDVVHTRTLLDKTGVAFHTHAGALQIPPTDAFNTIIEFAAA
jgi:hypothetical protein